jgi:hypothetical protein
MGLKLNMEQVIRIWRLYIVSQVTILKSASLLFAESITKFIFLVNFVSGN